MDVYVATVVLMTSERLVIVIDAVGETGKGKTQALANIVRELADLVGESNVLIRSHPRGEFAQRVMHPLKRNIEFDRNDIQLRAEVFPSIGGGGI